MGSSTTKCGAVLDVLLVEDDDGDVTLFSVGRDQADVHICYRRASSVAEAIAYLEGKGHYRDRERYRFPDAVVLDLTMPGKSGFDFLAWRKKTPQFARVPVIMVTGIDDPRKAEQALREGANAYLVKPPDPEAWKELVRTVWDLGVQLSQNGNGQLKPAQS